MALRNAERARVALYVGGMGTPGRNYYNNLLGRYGYEAEAAKIQDLYLSGDKAGAASAVQEESCAKRCWSARRATSGTGRGQSGGGRHLPQRLPANLRDRAGAINREGAGVGLIGTDIAMARR